MAARFSLPSDLPAKALSALHEGWLLRGVDGRKTCRAGKDPIAQGKSMQGQASRILTLRSLFLVDGFRLHILCDNSLCREQTKSA